MPPDRINSVSKRTAPDEEAALRDALGQLGFMTHNQSDFWSQPTLTVPEVAKLMRISRDSAYRAAREGQIPTLKIGRRLIVPTAQLARLLGREVVA